MKLIFRKKMILQVIFFFNRGKHSQYCVSDSRTLQLHNNFLFSIKLNSYFCCRKTDFREVKHVKNTTLGPISPYIDL